MKPGAEISAIGVYAWYHPERNAEATRLCQQELAPEERAALARAMLRRAFGLHFLEDVFAAGHVAGTWAPRPNAMARTTLQRRGSKIRVESEPRVDG